MLNTKQRNIALRFGEMKNTHKPFKNELHGGGEIVRYHEDRPVSG